MNSLTLHKNMQIIKYVSCQNKYSVKVNYSVWMLFYFFFFLHNIVAKAQEKNKEKLYQGVVLDEVMIKEVRKGFDVKGFIQKMQNDSTFYKGFKTLRLLQYSMYNDIQVENNKGDMIASYNSIAKQWRNNNCRSMEVKKEKTTGNFYKKNGDYRYYTAKLYAHLFFTKDTICHENNIVGKNEYHGTQKYEEQLRILIFNPGKKIKGIPGIGNNVAIFEEPTFSKYKFTLNREDFNGDDCYVFKAIPLKEYANNMVINELTTWIRVADDAIVARNYSLSYRTLFYDFDVEMKVKLKKVKQLLVPYSIQYAGNWHAVTKPREIVKFTAIFTDFE